MDIAPASSSELLQLIVEASLGLAGFAGIVVAVTHKGTQALPAIQRVNLMNLLATSFGALFISLMALGLMSAGVSSTSVWVVCSGIGLVTTLFFGVRSVRTVLAVSKSSAPAIRTLLWINIPLGVVCLIQIWNVVGLRTFWPTFLMISAFFALGCYSFVRLLFSARG